MSGVGLDLELCGTGIHVVDRDALGWPSSDDVFVACDECLEVSKVLESFGFGDYAADYEASCGFHALSELVVGGRKSLVVWEDWDECMPKSGNA